MKRFTKFFAAVLSVLMLLGAFAVSADDTDVVSENQRLVQVYLSVEGPDGSYAFVNGIFPGDGSVSAGDVITFLMEENYPDMELAGISDGYISSLNGIAGGIFGGYDGWLYIVKYSVTDENGDTQYYTDVPSVGINDYKIENASQIILYYGDYEDALAGYYTDENGMIKLVSYAPVYDEEYKLVEFKEAPLAGGSFTFTPVITDEKTGESALGEAITFIADENGLTKLDKDFKAVPNGLYIGSVGKQSDETATVGDITITKPEVARYTFVYTVDNHPTPEEIFMSQIFLLLAGMSGGPKG